MLKTPPEFKLSISIFSVAFSKRVWCKAELLFIGALCCPGSRTICNILRSLGLGQEKRFHKYHRFLSKDKWSGLRLGQLLLKELVRVFVAEGQPLVFGVDETVERRWGHKIKKRGIYRDAVRSSASHFVKCSGLRWMSLMLLSHVPWLEKGRYWALPVLTALCPSERYYQNRTAPRGHKTLMDWAVQMLAWLARYAKPLGHTVYLVGDGSYATYELMGKAAERGIGLVARMRIDARLFHFPPPSVPGKRGPKPKIGKRVLPMDKRLTDRRVKWKTVTFSEWYGHKDKKMEVTSGKAIWSRGKGQYVPVLWVLIRDPEGKLAPTLLACTDLDTDPTDVVRFFVGRWRVEVTFAEVRRHLGVETQRQWSDLAIERATPLLMGLMSTTCLLAAPLFEQGKIPLLTTAWYQKKHFTFSDILSAVRLHIWSFNLLSTSPGNSEVDNLKAKIRYLYQLLTQAVA